MKRIIFSLLLLFFGTSMAYADEKKEDKKTFDPNKILGSKHDFTGLNKRAGVVAMSGVAFSDFGSPCIYCHLPEGKTLEDNAEKGGNMQWNRFVPATQPYELYDSRTLDNKVKSPSSISLLCLSCHDGTMGIDMTVFKPNGWQSSEDEALHLRLNGADNLMSCGKCHDGKIAHNIQIKHIGTDLTNDHPISMTYAGLTHEDKHFNPPDSKDGFDNGIKLYDGKVECATCHNIHEPDIGMLLRVRADKLCETCHIK